MKDKKKRKEIKRQNIDYSFNSQQLTLFSGLAPIMKFFDRIGLVDEFESHFKTIRTNATKFSHSQLMLSVVLASLSGICHLSRIAVFTSDVLVQALLGLPNGLNKDVISTRFKELGQGVARRLEELNGRRIYRQLSSAFVVSQ